MTTDTDAKVVAMLPPADVTLVKSPACHFCADAEDVLAAVSHDFELSIRRVDTRSPEGMAMVQDFGAAMSPLVLLDGAFVSAGRLSRGKLRKLLEARLDRSAVSSR
jgi:glutaredoxin